MLHEDAAFRISNGGSLLDLDKFCFHDLSTYQHYHNFHSVLNLYTAESSYLKEGGGGREDKERNQICS